MKKYITLIFWLLSSFLYAQSYFKTINPKFDNFNYHSTFIIKIIDSETRMPIEGAIVSLDNIENYTLRLASSNGIALLIYKAFGPINRIYIEITHPDYLFKEFEILPYDYKDKVGSIKLVLPEIKKEEVEPYEVAEEIKLGRYYTSYGGGYQSVGVYELKVEMDRIKRKFH